MTTEKMKYQAKDHTFVLCAYKENPNLEECILSLINQKLRTNILVATSTPNEHIQKLCDQYELPLWINTGKAGIAYDWNFGYMQAKTPLVTIAHQDDIYEPDYAKTVIRHANRAQNPIIIYTNYYEIRNGERVDNNRLLRIKKLMNAPLKLSLLQKSRFVRKRILSVGNPICCPAVTLNKKICGNNVFYTPYKNSCDYMTWALLASHKGSFVYDKRALMAHRIYAESTTTLNIQENIRAKEDFEIMCMFWPKWMARILFHFYSKSMDSNET